MPDPAQSAVNALCGATTETVGRFRFDIASGSWWWSPDLYTIYGFTPGEIVPTTALMAAHQHPGDRPWAAELTTATVTAGKSFCSRHRIIDSRQREHTVVTVAEGVRDVEGQLVQVRGYLVDVTDSLHRDLSAAARKAVDLSAESRSAIEQAKGALMITYGMNEDEAFEMLRFYSQNTNVKLRDIASGITEHANDPGIANLPAQDKIAEILVGITDPVPARQVIPMPADKLNSTDDRISA